MMARLRSLASDVNAKANQTKKTTPQAAMRELAICSPSLSFQNATMLRSESSLSGVSPPTTTATTTSTTKTIPVSGASR